MVAEGDRDRTQPIGARGPSSHFATILAILMLTVLATLALAMQARGTGSRWNPDDVLIVAMPNDSPELLRTWDDLGVSNAVLVEVTGQLGFQLVSLGSDVQIPSEYPFPEVEFRDFMMIGLNRETRLWLASQRGYFRTIHYVLSPDELELRVAQGRQAGSIGISDDGQSVHPYNDGYLRHIRSVFPQVDEPVVLDVDVSYFEWGDPEVLYEQFLSSGLDVRVLTYDRALDSTSTSEEARDRLEVFIELMGDAS